MSASYYYSGDKLPTGLYVHRPPHVVLVTEQGEQCAFNILFPRRGVQSSIPGKSASAARIRIRQTLQIDGVEILPR